MIWGYVIAAIVGLAGSAYYSKKAAQEAAEAGSGLFVNKNGAANDLPIIYGKRRVGMLHAWKGTSNDGLKTNTYTSTGDARFVPNQSGINQHWGNRGNNAFLHRIDAIAMGEIEAVTDIMIDGDHYTNARFSNSGHNYYRGIAFYGSNTQSMPSNLAQYHSEVTTSMDGKGVSWIWNTFLFRESDLQYQGEPSVTATVKGLKVWDPRTNPSDSSVKSYSTNPALCLLDYLMADYGKKLPQSELNIQSFIDAANSCEDQVDVPNGAVNTGSNETIYNPYTGEDTTWFNGNYHPFYNSQYNSNNTIDRFECNIVLKPSDTTTTNVEKLLKTMRASLPFSQGQYNVVLEDTSSSVMAFDETNLLGGVNVAEGDRSKRLNRVTVKFDNNQKDWEEDTVTWPEIYSTQHDNYIAEDNNEELHQEIRLEGTTDYYRAEDIAEFIVRDSREQMAVEFKTQPEAMKLEPGDVISLTYAPFNFTNKLFRVRSVVINANLTVDVQAQAYNSTVYPWANKTEEAVAPYVKLDPFATPAAVNNLAAAGRLEENADGTNTHFIDVTWDSILDATNPVEEIRVGYKKSTDTLYTVLKTTSDITDFTISGIADNTTYDIEVTYKTVNGKISADATTSVTLANNSSTLKASVATVNTAASNAQATATAAQSTATTAQTTANSAQTAADNAQVDATQAIADAASKIAAADVENAIANNVTNIDGAKITTGTVQAARIDIVGKNVSDLTNDSGFTDDTAADAAQTTANAANDLAQDGVDDAAAALNVANSKITAAEVENAIVNDVTTIDGAKITTGTLALNKLVSTPLIADDVSSTGTTVIDGGRITTNTLSGDTIKADSQILVGSGSDTAGINGQSGSEYRFWSGSELPSGANFNVKQDGSVQASAITIADANGTVMFDSESGFTDAAKQSIVGDSAQTVATRSEIQTATSTNTMSFELTDAKTCNITVTLTPSHAADLFGSNVSTLLSNFPTAISVGLTVNGSNQTAQVFSRVTQDNSEGSTIVTPSSSQYKVNYIFASNINRTYASYDGQTLTATFTNVSLNSGINTLVPAITGTGSTNGLSVNASYNVATIDASTVIRTNSTETSTITTTEPTTVGTTLHGHVFYVYN